MGVIKEGRKRKVVVMDMGGVLPVHAGKNKPEEIFGTVQNAKFIFATSD